MKPLRILCGLVVCVSLVACNKDNPEIVDTPKAVDISSSQDNVIVTAQELIVPPATESDNPLSYNPLAAVVGASEIPYPLYPNGTKYRVGGENGLKIVVFQTEDPFHKVDDYYSDVSDDKGMARLLAMTDYVRYSNGTDDLDPWATHKPGIVIHEFDGEHDREAVGASAAAKTNIIMSF